MIKAPTTFIIGAGASNCYGLPVGSTLLARAKGLGTDSAAYHLVRRHTEIPPDRLADILADIRHFPGASIDDFLQKRQPFDDIQRVGRTLIATFMGESVIRDLALPPKKASDDWLKSLFLQMAEGADTFEHFVSGNRVTFVTFNFDSVIETRLSALADGAYRTGNVTETLAAAVPVIHVHGRLPAPPEAQLRLESDSEPSPAWLQWMPNAASQIRVVFDGDMDESTLEQARSAISGSAVVCFLGFSYHPTNVDRLKLEVWDRSTTRLAFGTTLGMSDGERQRVRRRLAAVGSQLNLDVEGRGCRAFLEAVDVYL